MATVKRGGIVGTAVLTVALVFSSVGVRISSAEPITVTFIAYPSPRDFGALPAFGSFTFDSSIVPFRGSIQRVVDGGGLADEISFQWGSTAWTTANAGVWLLAVDRTTGRLLSWGLVGPQSGGVITWPAEDVRDLINVGVEGRTERPQSYFAYTYRGREGAFEGSLLWSQDRTFTPVPEPGTLLLLGSGALYLIRRRMGA